MPKETAILMLDERNCMLTDSQVDQVDLQLDQVDGGIQMNEARNAS